ncbi:MAG: hypothetical protein MUP47_02710 [Phycisphaerae bacterium]|nr:hypothetical protein [Phycisphaerae bacterium]
MTPGERKRGSVLLMVIGLLTVIAMLGSMLLLIARLDRQTSQAQASASLEDHAAQGILDRLIADRLNDLYINGTVLYGRLDSTDALTAERQMIDYPAEGYDDALACIEPVLEPVGGTMWRHLSNWTRASGTLVTNIPVNDPSLADTDGDGLKDARLFSTGVLDRDGGALYAAVRMIDAAGLVNVNVAGVPPRRAQVGVPMGPRYLALENLLPLGSAQQVVDDRANGPYDMGDMLALAWGRADPCATNGRLVEAVVGAGGDFLAARGSLTTHSPGGTLSPLWTYLVAGAGTMKRNPNDAGVLPSDPSAQEIRRRVYDGALAMLQAYEYDSNPGPTPNRVKAAQLVVNLIDYLDSDPNVTRIDANTLDPSVGAVTYVYGIERHPFVSKVFRKRIYVDLTTPPTEVAAIELINPYAQRIDLTNYSLENYPGTDMTNKGIDAAGPNGPGRFVIYSGNFDKADIDPNVPDPSSLLQVTGLTADPPVKILWKHPVESWSVCVDQTPVVNCPAPNASKPAYWHVTFRDDRLNRARYSLATALAQSTDDPSAANDDDPNYDYTDPPDPNNRMGASNPTNLVDAIVGAPTPVYVRNEGMICLGDMMRLFTVGPTEAVPLSARMSAPGAQLVPWGDSVPTAPPWFGPRVPLGCLVSEFFNLVPTDPNGTIGGLVNINTAPASVLNCLPALADIPQMPGQTWSPAAEIAAYRDLGTTDGRDYSVRATPTGITGLRNQAGFACASEVAIPLRTLMQARGIVYNSYSFTNVPPENYALGPGTPANDDDGIPIRWSSPPPYQAVLNDPVKQHVLYGWLSNQVTVRSNTFIVYIRVQRDSDPNTHARYYVAVIDRSECPAQPPRALLFTELR